MKNMFLNYKSDIWKKVHKILLHVWGFLGQVMWALLRNNAVVHCYISLAMQQFKWRAYQQHCYARNNRHRDVSMVFGILLILSVLVWKESGADVRACLAMDSSWLEEWVSVPRPYRMDVYMCSKGCWLCLTVFSCVLGSEEIGRTRCVRSAIDCN
jgi:hypothetical protein